MVEGCEYAIFKQWVQKRNGGVAHGISKQIMFLLIVDIAVIERYVNLNSNVKFAAGLCQRDLKKKESVAVLHDVKR